LLRVFQFLAIALEIHDGILLGGETYELLGKEHAYENQDDQGMYMLTKDEDDRMFFNGLLDTGLRRYDGF
jgi:hypothetical protein